MYRLLNQMYTHIIWKLRIHTQSKSPIPCPLFTPLRIMNIDIKIKVATGLVWILGKCGVYNWDQKSYKMCTYMQYRLAWSTHKMLILTHTEVTNAISTVYTTLYYGYRHKNKGTGIVLVPKKCGMYKRDQESYSIQDVYSIPIDMKYTQNAHPHTLKSHQCHVYCLHHSIITNALVWFWYIESVGCTNETKKATRCALYTYTQNPLLPT